MIGVNVKKGDRKMLHEKWIHVSPEGKDEAEGSLESPFATISRAKTEARKAIKAGYNVRVKIHEGTYRFNTPLRFDIEDSGTEDVSVIYEAYEDQDVNIYGSRMLQLRWEPYEGGIMQAKLPTKMQIDQLYIDGQLYHMARYPNFDPDIRIMNGYAADADSPKRASRWSDPSDGFVHAMHSHLWGDYHYKIVGKAQDHQLLLEGGWQNNRQMGMHEQYKYVENIFEELDAPGEWYYDEKQNVLYVIPYDDTDLVDAKVEAVHSAHLIEVVGTSSAPIRNITFKGLTFSHTSRTFMENREPLLRSDWTIYRGGAVLLRGTEHCVIQDCQFVQLGGNAVFIDGYNRHAKITGCLFEEIGSNGVAFVGHPETVRSPLFEYEQRQKLAEIDRERGPKSEQYPAQCLVEDCLITRVGRVEKQSAPIQISMSLDITIRHCSIYEVPRAGINISEGTFGGHIIEHCDIFDTVLETGDHGSFNAWGRDRYWMLEDLDLDEINADENMDDDELPLLDMIRPNIIRNNRWRCDYGWDIDLDDGSSWYEIYNNLCLSGGIKLREGFYRLCENNIMVNNSLHPHIWFKGSRDIVRRNIVFSEYAPIRVPLPWGKEVDCNVLHTEGETNPSPAISLQEQSGRDEHSVQADALFINPDVGDYRVQENSPALQIGFVNFPMDQFGVRKPALKKRAKTPKLPKIGEVASESGRLPQHTKWGNCKVKNIVGMGEVSAAGLPAETGVLIETVPWGSWQNESGFQIADVILEINGAQVDHVDDLLSLYAAIEQDAEFDVIVFRGQRRKCLQGKKKD